MVIAGAGKHKMLKNFILTCLMLLFLVNSTIRNVQAHKRYCGDNLVQALSILCEHGFYTRTTKRADPLHTWQPDLPISAENGNTEIFSSLYTGSPFIPKYYNSLIFTQRQRRHHIGAYDECCSKACELSELSAYCLPKDVKMSAQNSITRT
ncbi:probable insulin-like peptide 1 [Stomoxys calcitrans]|uniref:probable insulin-like peptide 1 n=1 Tax=Stomoxys calcitrans TaxID=35570 RepID=UPI0027E364B5|nr:probable insulin-like peptide 1 [Stomoxys calcitrans]